MTTEKGIALVERDEDGVDKAFRQDVLAGLRQQPKAIPARWFYDEEGSRLFEKITQVEEYYPTRAETEILTARGAEFAKLIGPGRVTRRMKSASTGWTGRPGNLAPSAAALSRRKSPEMSIGT